MNIITTLSSSSNFSDHAIEADQKETKATQPKKRILFQKVAPEKEPPRKPISIKPVFPPQGRRFKDGSLPSGLLLIQELGKILGSYHATADEGKGHSFDPGLFILIANYYDDEVIGDYFLSSIAFGKKMWNSYFGDIGEAPSLPNDICSILTGPCPFDSEQRAADTHMLVLVPEKLNGTAMTLKRLGELMKSLCKPGYKLVLGREFVIPSESVPTTSAIEDAPFEATHWVLMKKDVIDRNLYRQCRSYEEQLKLVAKYPNYHVPKLSEAVTAIFMEYIVSGIQHYSQSDTRCQETCFLRFKQHKKVFDKVVNLVVGPFQQNGLHVYDEWHDPGITVVRRF